MGCDKYHNFRLELYPDDPKHQEAFIRLKSLGWNYVGILHDADVFDYDDLDRNITIGDPVKPHFHFVINIPGSARYVNGVAKELGIDSRWLLPCIEGTNGDKVFAIRYLLHMDKPEAFQYSSDSLFGNWLSYALSVVTESADKPCEADEVLRLVSLLDGCDTMTYRQYLTLACQNGLWPYFRKLGYGVKMLLEEHNHPKL